MKRVIALLACACLLAVPLPASADEIYPLIFPVTAPNHFTDTYNAPRDGGTRLHEATDIMADKMAPVVAASDGVIRWMSTGSYKDCNGVTSPSYSLSLEHSDGWVTRYIHLNNDTPGTDDGLGVGYAPGISVGTQVAAGQLLGWVGDSGNAECTAPHLHFELYRPDGTKMNPYESLLAAGHADPAAADEIFFYRDDGLFRYYDIGPDARIGSPLAAGDGYTRDWDTIISINLDGDGNDEMFFYREDGLFRFYDSKPDGSLPSPMLEGNGYTTGWSSIAAVDLDGDSQDEMFFYRNDGLYRFYDVRPNGSIGTPIRSGDGYTRDWDAITALDIDGDGQDEMFFYRNDGLYRYYDVRPNGSLPSPMSSGSDYPTGWTSITVIDLHGDGKDELMFYREDGTFAYHRVNANGTLGATILAGTGYTQGWNAIASVNLDG